ncbi:hypothetical protein [Streptomyces nanshensis]|uniref:hypothetical protein n=1 Tax=Streptomyces nanshensis TaxID=518642 RepID=UPI00085CA808|nr:hypothetical protein [Streptomyces nanshensis]
MPAAAPGAGVLCCWLHPNLTGHLLELAGLLAELEDEVELQPPGSALVDLTRSVRAGHSPGAVAGMVNLVARERYGLALRLGVGPNPFLARLAAIDAHLGAVRKVAVEDAAGFIRGWDVSHLGIARDQAERMRAAGLRSAGDVAAVPPETLRSYVGTDERAHAVHLAAHGIDRRTVTGTPRSDRPVVRRAAPAVEAAWRLITGAES